MSFFRRVRDFFLREDKSVKEEAFPVSPPELAPFDFTDYADYVLGERQRYLGAFPRSETQLINGTRILEYYGHEAPTGVVPGTKQIYFETIINHPTEGAFLIKGGFRTGEEFDPAKFRKILVAKLKEKYEWIEDGYALVDAAQTRTSFYFRSYVPNRPTLAA